MTWVPIWILPNLNLDEPVESKYFVLAPNDDCRVRTLRRENPEFDKLFSRFRDVHGEPIRPALIIRRAKTPKRLTTLEPAVSFRDILVVSSVLAARSKNLVYGTRHNQPALANYFWLYPWMIDKDFKYVIANTLTTLALHEASAIHGQSSADLTPIHISRHDFDEPLLGTLLARWASRYDSINPKWEDIALFRSLNLANQACSVPSGPDATIFDLGRIVSLWVSAFETLVHPGANGKASLKEVYNLLENVPWLDSRLRHRRYKTRLGGNFRYRNISCWIYSKLYNCRNKFLHGEPFDNKVLNFERSGRPVIHFAPPLYRLGLTSCLDLSLGQNLPTSATSEALGVWIARRMEFEQPQEDAERALRRALISVDKQERIRREGIASSRRRSGNILSNP